MDEIGHHDKDLFLGKLGQKKSSRLYLPEPYSKQYPDHCIPSLPPQLQTQLQDPVILPYRPRAP